MIDQKVLDCGNCRAICILAGAALQFAKRDEKVDSG